MTITMRSCRGHEEFAAISDFHYSLYQPDNRDGNWFQPIWEYAYTHPLLDDEAVNRIGIWEEDGDIVALATYEWKLGEAFFAVQSEYEHLKPEMLTYAEEQLTGLSDEEPDVGKRYLKAYIPSFDKAFEAEAKSRGYTLHPQSHRPMSQFVIPDPFPPIRLPEGFKLKSLADDNDLVKVDRALWYGFEHEGEPSGDLSGRIRMQSGPNYRKDLNIVVEAPNGDFVSYAGQWFEPVNKFGYVEPVATVPEYRRMGLASAAVLEGIRRSAELGAKVAYVGADKPVYLSIGFKPIYVANCWYKTF